MKNIAVLGSTGSIGKNTLEIVSRFPDRFKITTLSAKTNISLLAKQIIRFRPEAASVVDEHHRDLLNIHLKQQGIKFDIELLCGMKGYDCIASWPSVNVVVTAVVGAAGLSPTVAAINAGKTIALANKETLVTAGEIIMNMVKKQNITILPVDSEHSAIFQSLSGQRRKDLKTIFLTASGGPFRNTPKSDFSTISVKQALAHPTWQMGRKITIDSATLMNKGLEVIEAKWLFDVSPNIIEVVVHPQSIVHSMVGYIDGSVIAQLSVPDMKGAIAYALSYPERLDLGLLLPDFFKISSLTFEAPDMDKFRCLKFAYEVLETGGTAPAVLNAANEIAVEAFLDEKISFEKIPIVIEKTLNQHNIMKASGIEDIFLADETARERAQLNVMSLMR